MERNMDRENEHSVDQKAGVCVNPASRDHKTDFAARHDEIERNARMAKQGIGLCAAPEPEAAAIAVTQLTNNLKPVMNEAKALHTRSEYEASSLRETAAKYNSTNPGTIQRKVDEVISQQNETLARLDKLLGSAATNAQLRLETAIVRGDKLGSLRETIATQSANVREVLTNFAGRLNEVHLQMRTLSAEIKQTATRRLDYSWSKNVEIKRVEAGIVTVAVKPGETGRGTIRLPDNTIVDVRFETTRSGSVKNWTATCSGNDVKLVRPEGAVNHGSFFAAAIVRDTGTTKVTTQETSDTKKSVNGNLEGPLKVVSVGVGGDASWGGSAGKAVEHTTNHQTSTAFGVQVIFEPRPQPPVEVWNGNKRTIVR
jgi:hypothetical protein